MFNSPKYRRFLVIAYSIIIHGMAPSDSFKYQFEIKKKEEICLKPGFSSKTQKYTNLHIYFFKYRLYHMFLSHATYNLIRKNCAMQSCSLFISFPLIEIIQA